MKRFRKRLSASLQNARHSIDEGLSELAEHLSLRDSNGNVSINETNGHDNHNNNKTSFLLKASRRFSLSTSRIIDVSTPPGVVHEHPRIGSDGESEEASGASDEVISPVTNSHYIPNNNVNNGNVRMRTHRTRRLNPQDISKRLSLPADLRLPESFLAKQSLSPTLDGPLSRKLRRQSLVTDLNEFSLVLIKFLCFSSL
jgi:hypothetical protein